MRTLKDLSESSREEADAALRLGFGIVVKAYREASGRDNDDLHTATRPRLTQGNPGAVRDLEHGKGWIHPDVATELFVELQIPDATRLGDAYRTLKDLVDGRSEPTYRRRDIDSRPK